MILSLKEKIYISKINEQTKETNKIKMIRKPIINVKSTV